jgi:bacteriorhodopsin
MLVTSTIISIIIQLITGVIDIWGLTIPIPENYLIYSDLLKIELGVQFIELLFYIWLVVKIKSISNITIYRYVDWFITTPIMLFTLIVFLYHDGNKLKVKDFVTSNKTNIIIIVILNALMLMFGLLGELGILSITTSVTLGFVPFAYYFWYIYKTYIHGAENGIENGIENGMENGVKNSIISLNTKKYIFYYFLIFWSIYGICAYLPYNQKNLGYTILDLFAKNVFGILIVYFIWHINKNKKLIS